MFYCGDDASAKTTVATLIADLGWEPFDVGGLVQALHLEVSEDDRRAVMALPAGSVLLVVVHSTFMLPFAEVIL